MIEFIFGLFGVVFFGGGLLLIYLKDKEKLDWKLVLIGLLLIVSSIYTMIDSGVASGNTIVMETGNETFNNNDTVIAGDYEYTVRKIGTEKTLSDYGTDKNASGKYLIFEIIIKNNSNYPFAMDTIINPPFYLLNQEKYYKVNRDLSRSLTDDETDEYGYWTQSNFINPGNEMIGYAVFDIQEEVINSDQTQLVIPTDDSAPNDIYLYIN